MAKTIKLNEVTAKYALYGQFDGQTKDCYIWLDCDSATMGAAYNSEIGNAVPSDVYHGLVRRYYLPYPIYSDSANGLMADILPLAQRVCAGFEVVWDGHNHVGKLSDDALQAESEIEHLIEQSLDEESDAIKVWDAADWLADTDPLTVAEELGITADMSEDDVLALEDKAVELYLDPGNCDIITNMGGYLKHHVLEAVWERAEGR